MYASQPDLFTNTYIWEEGTDDQGADNIISCLHLDLACGGLFDVNRPSYTILDHLVLGADNCSGQNKNKAMLKYCMWLVEAGFVKKVTLLFLVKGHTKNHCDKFFNILKRSSIDENIWTAEQLDAAYTEGNKEYISLLQLGKGDTRWRGWKDGLNTLYNDPTCRTILVNHEFMFGENKCLTIMRHRSIGILHKLSSKISVQTTGPPSQVRNSRMPSKSELSATFQKS